MDVAQAKGVFDRSDAATRSREGLKPRVGVLAGKEAPQLIEVVEDGVRYGVDVRVGHKTGFYIDQRESRLAAQRIAADFLERTGRGLRALNCFCYTGGFSLALMKGGAQEVVSVDSSSEALARAQANAALNGFDDARMKWLEDGPEKARAIDEMIRILQEDAPIMFGYYPKAAAAFHEWVLNAKPTSMVRNSLQYIGVDEALRAERIREWNRPVLWPLLLIVPIAWILVRALRAEARRREERRAKPSPEEKR